MFRKERGTIREVEPEVVSFGDLALVPSAGPEAISPAEEIEPAELEVETVPPVAVMTPAAEAQPMVKPDPPGAAATPRPHRRRRKRRNRQRNRPTQKAASAMPAPPPPARTAPISDPVVETVAREPEPEAEVEQPAELEDLTCEILFWRGYRKATFYARIFSLDGEPLALAQSSEFRARGNGIPEQTEEAVAAYEELRARLEQWGWQHASSGRAWFGDVFTRPV
jgi:hypothetical protein